MTRISDGTCGCDSVPNWIEKINGAVSDASAAEASAATAQETAEAASTAAAAATAAAQTNATAISAETTARTAADTTLQANIDAEASTRATADTALQANIDAEANARTSADSALQTEVDALTREIPNDVEIVSDGAGAIHAVIHQEDGTQIAGTSKTIISAGANIEISTGTDGSTVIAATGGGEGTTYTPGEGISISGTVISADPTTVLMTSNTALDAVIDNSDGVIQMAVNGSAVESVALRAGDYMGISQPAADVLQFNVSGLVPITDYNTTITQMQTDIDAKASTTALDEALAGKQDSIAVTASAESIQIGDLLTLLPGTNTEFAVDGTNVTISRTQDPEVVIFCTSQSSLSQLTVTGADMSTLAGYTSSSPVYALYRYSYTLNGSTYLRFSWGLTTSTIIVSYYDASTGAYRRSTGNAVDIDQTKIGSENPNIFVAIVPK